MSSFTNWFGKLMYKAVAKIFWAYRFCAGCITSNHIKKIKSVGRKKGIWGHALNTPDGAKGRSPEYFAF